MKSWACRKPTAKRRSAPPIASSPSATTLTSTPASRRRRSGSRRSAPPTTSCPTRTSARVTTAARSTPPATKCRHSGRSTATSAMPPGARNTVPTPASIRRTWTASSPRHLAGGPAPVEDGGFRCAARMPGISSRSISSMRSTAPPAASPCRMDARSMCAFPRACTTDR